MKRENSQRDVPGSGKRPRESHRLANLVSDSSGPSGLCCDPSSVKGYSISRLALGMLPGDFLKGLMAQLDTRGVKWKEPAQEVNPGQVQELFSDNHKLKGKGRKRWILSLRVLCKY